MAAKKQTAVANKPRPSLNGAQKAINKNTPNKNTPNKNTPNKTAQKGAKAGGATPNKAKFQKQSPAKKQVPPKKVEEDEDDDSDDEEEVEQKPTVGKSPAAKKVAAPQPQAAESDDDDESDDDEDSEELTEKLKNKFLPSKNMEESDDDEDDDDDDDDDSNELKISGLRGALTQMGADDDDEDESDENDDEEEDGQAPGKFLLNEAEEDSDEDEGDDDDEEDEDEDEEPVEAPIQKKQKLAPTAAAEAKPTKAKNKKAAKGDAATEKPKSSLTFQERTELLMKNKERAIWIQNLKPKTTEQQIREHFKDCGTIELVHVDQRQGTHANVLFGDSDQMEEAVKLHNSVLNGVTVAVRYGDKARNTRSSDPKCTIKLLNKNNLEGIPGSRIISIFEKCGEIASCDVLCNRHVLGFVNFKNEKSVKKALALNGTTVDDIELEIEQYKPLPPNYSVFIHNVHTDTKEEDLRKVFETSGPIENIQLHGRTAIIHYKDTDGFSKSFLLNESIVLGRKLYLEPLATHKKNNERHFGGGGGSSVQQRSPFNKRPFQPGQQGQKSFGGQQQRPFNNKPRAFGGQQQPRQFNNKPGMNFQNGKPKHFAGGNPNFGNKRPYQNDQQQKPKQFKKARPSA